MNAQGQSAEIGTPSDVLLSGLRGAAAVIRQDWDRSPDYWEGRPSRAVSTAKTWLAVADWLDTAEADLWAHGPLCCDGCMDCDDSLWMPHVRRALAVADAYLDGSAR